MNEAQMYRKILTAVKECRRDKVKMFGSGLPLTERVIKRLQDNKLNIFAVAKDGKRTFLVSGYMLEEVKLKDITPTREEWEAAKAKAAMDRAAGIMEDTPVQGPYLITETVEMPDAD